MINLKNYLLAYGKIKSEKIQVLYKFYFFFFLWIKGKLEISFHI